MPQTTEIALDLLRITTYIEPINFQFSQFLVRNDEPLLFHTGMWALFPAVKDAVASLSNPGMLRSIGFNRFEPDKYGTLPE